jgi:hypothetical protein
MALVVCPSQNVRGDASEERRGLCLTSGRIREAQLQQALEKPGALSLQLRGLVSEKRARARQQTHLQQRLAAEHRQLVALPARHVVEHVSAGLLVLVFEAMLLAQRHGLDRPASERGA